VIQSCLTDNTISLKRLAEKNDAENGDEARKATIASKHAAISEKIRRHQ